MILNNTPSYITKENLNHFIAEAVREDIGNGDHTTNAIFNKTDTNKAKLLVKEDGILAGVQLAEYIFSQADSDIQFNKKMNDGDKIKFGDIAFTVEGSARTILTYERLVLNCMQRMSGIATLTQKMNAEINHTKAKLLDTRKTTPNFRICEKWAVAIAGGTNHRYGLYDMVMIKDNHVDYAGGIQEAVKKVKDYLKENKLELKIEVETRNLTEVKEALEANIDRIMLDNFTPELMKDAVAIIGHKTETEASGGINLKNLRSFAETGVNYISSGALTHSAKNIDLSLKAF